MRRASAFVVLIVVVAPATTAAGFTPANEQPLAEAGLDQTVALGDTVLLDGAGSRDPDGEIVSYSWTITAPNGTPVTPACPSCPRTSFVPPTSGVYEVHLTVTDDDGAASTDTLYVTVESDSGPTVSLSGPGQIDAGNRGRFRATAAAGSSKLDTAVWRIDGSVVRRSDISGRHARPTLRRQFPTAGDRTVTITVVDEQGRRATAETSVSVDATVTLGGGTDINSSSGEPSASILGPDSVEPGAVANFDLRTTTPGAVVVNYEWSNAELADSGDPTQAVHTFDEAEGSTVMISATIETNRGRTATAVKPVEIETTADPTLSISSPDVHDNGTVLACGETPVDLKATPYHFESAIDTYSWSDVDSSNHRWASVNINGNDQRKETVEVMATSLTGETATATYTFRVDCNERDMTASLNGLNTYTSVNQEMTRTAEATEPNPHQDGNALPSNRDTIIAEATIALSNVETADTDTVTVVFETSQRQRVEKTVPVSESGVISTNAHFNFNADERLDEPGKLTIADEITVTVLADGDVVAGGDSSAAAQKTLTWFEAQERESYGFDVRPGDVTTTGKKTDVTIVLTEGHFDGDVTVRFGDGSTPTITSVSGHAGGTNSQSAVGASTTKKWLVYHTWSDNGKYTVTLTAEENANLDKKQGRLEDGTDEASSTIQVFKGSSDDGSSSSGDAPDSRQQPDNDGGTNNGGAVTDNNTPGGLPSGGLPGGRNSGQDVGGDGGTNGNGASTSNNTPGGIFGGGGPFGGGGLFDSDGGNSSGDTGTSTQSSDGGNGFRRGARTSNNTPWGF